MPGGEIGGVAAVPVTEVSACGEKVVVIGNGNAAARGVINGIAAAGIGENVVKQVVVGAAAVQQGHVARVGAGHVDAVEPEIDEATAVEKDAISRVSASLRGKKVVGDDDAVGSEAVAVVELQAGSLGCGNFVFGINIRSKCKI